MRRLALPCLLLALCLPAGCVGNADTGPARTPWTKLERVLAIDFSPRAGTRRIAAFRRLEGLPAAEARRVSALTGTASKAPAALERRLLGLPRPVARALQSELARATALARPGPRVLEALPQADRFAATTARNAERLGFLLGLERRPLSETSDREYRTDPHDDRPEATLWQRLKRRIFP